MKNLAVLFKAMHSIDIDANEIREKTQIPQEFENFINELINFITNNSNVKNYKVHDDNTQTVACVSRIITYVNCSDAMLEHGNIIEQIHDQSESIADKLLRVEVEAQQQIEATGQNVKKGSLIQALISDINDNLYFVLAKVEHREWYDGESLLKNFGFPNDKKNVWKSVVFQVSLDEGNIVFERIQVYTDNAAKYWANQFLELEEERNDSTNTRLVFSLVEQTLERCVKKISESDYTILRNTLIGEMKKQRLINYDEFIDELVLDYYPENQALNMQEVRAKLIKIGNQNKFDKQFQTDPSQVKARRKHKYKPISGVELSIVGAIDNLKRNIRSKESDENGRYLEICCTDNETFEAFKFND